MLSSRHVPQEALPHFENAIYLPMLLTILTRDKEIIEKSPIKLKKPYISMIDRALDAVQKDLTETNKFFRKQKMKLEKEATCETFTDFIFYHQGYADPRRYLNVRLRNRSEELLALYLAANVTEIKKETTLPFD